LVNAKSNLPTPSKNMMFDPPFRCLLENHGETPVER
jgi:hypothetical protein